MPIINKRVVIFVSSVYDEARNGPAIYAKYLTEYFGKGKHGYAFKFVGANYHVKKLGLGLITYFNISIRANRICKYYRKMGYSVICHYNIPSNFIIKNSYASCIITQANDTKQVELFNSFYENLKQHGIRRIFSILVRKFIEINAFKASDLVVANSDYTLEVLKREYSDEYSFLRIYKGVDLSAFKSNSSNKTDTSNVINMISVGSDWKTKNFSCLMDVVAKINSKHAKDIINLTIVGVDDESFAATCKNFSFVKNLGPLQREALVDEMNLQDVFVLASKDEALGVSLLEASAIGLFVIGSNVGGIPEIIDNNSSGFLFDPFDQDSLFAAIEKYMNLTIDERSIFIDKSMSKAKAFSQTTMLNNVCELYEKQFSLL
jgi:glycosyltransferase involved in cell wall biosynthesis